MILFIFLFILKRDSNGNNYGCQVVSGKKMIFPGFFMGNLQPLTLKDLDFSPTVG